MRVVLCHRVNTCDEYEKIPGWRGTIKNTNYINSSEKKFGDIGIELDGTSNPYDPDGLYWLNETEIKVTDSEKASYKETIPSLPKDFKIGDKIHVVALRGNRSKKYQKLDKLYGVIEIADNLNDNYGVRFDKYVNPDSGKGLYWFNEREIKIVPLPLSLPKFSLGEMFSVGDNIRIIIPGDSLNGQEGRIMYDNAWGDPNLYEVVIGGELITFRNNQMKLISKNNKTKSEENNMLIENNNKTTQVARCKELLDLWLGKHVSIANSWADSKMRSTLEDDPILSEALQCSKNIIDAINDQEGVFVSYDIPSENFIYEYLLKNGIMYENTKDNTSKLGKVNQDFIKDIKNQYNEILAFLKAADTYEQELDILINYDVLDEFERLYVDEDLVRNDLNLMLGELQYAAK